MTARFDDETLVAYVDGELDEAAARRVEAAIGQDPKLAETVRALREGAAALRAAFAGPVHHDVPDRLRETVDVGFAARRRDGGDRTGYHRPVLAAMAASLAIMAIGIGAAYVFLESQVERRLARLEAAREADRDIIQAAVAMALEKHLSGVPATWQNPQSGSHGQVEPVRTFRSAGGQWCREYVVTADLRSSARQEEVRRAIACRDDAGQWRTRLELSSES